MLHVYIPNIKALCFAVPDKNIYSPFPIIAYIDHVFIGSVPLWPLGHNLDKIGKGLLDNAT